MKIDLARVAGGATFLFGGDHYTKLEGNLAIRYGSRQVFRFEPYDLVEPLGEEASRVLAVAAAKRSH